MVLELLLPAGVTAAATASTLLWRRQLSPRLATGWATAFAVTAALAVLWTELTVLAGALGHLPPLVSWLGWCRDLYRPHDAVPPVAGVLAGGALLLSTVGLIRQVLQERRAVHSLPGGVGPVQLLDSPDLIALAVPGRPGRVVVSTAMLDALSPGERRVLFAHEESHLAHRHHWFRVVVQLAAAAVPPLRGLSAEVTFATERWADEDAVRAVGDRMLVARAISRAALAKVERSDAIVASVAGSNVLARVEAVLSPPKTNGLRFSAPNCGALAALAVAVVSSSAQLHHLLGLIFHVCNR